MLQVFSPAKINLFLKIIRKRPDGYHELASLFQTINLGDTLDFHLASHDELTCSDPSLPTDENNLVLKATHLYRKKTGIKAGLKVHLNKYIPSQAGLGGGSGNAATTLWAFNELVGKIATDSELQSWAGEIGSDIPFFFSSGTAYCTGRGEQVCSLDPLQTQSCWIVKPRIGLSTPEVYRRVRMTQTSIPFDDLSTLNSFLRGERSYFNDLEQPAFEAKPELQDLKARLLKCGFETVLMTGSGSAFFCLGRGRPPSDPNLSSYVVQFLNRTPTNWYKKN